MDHLFKKASEIGLGIAIITVAAIVVIQISKQAPNERSEKMIGSCQDKAGAFDVAKEYIRSKTKDRISQFDVIKPKTILATSDGRLGCLIVVFSSYCYKTKAGDKHRDYRVSLNGGNYAWSANDHAFDLFGPPKASCEL